MMAKASFTYRTVDQSVAGWGEKNPNPNKPKIGDKERKNSEKQENIMRAYRLLKQ